MKSIDLGIKLKETEKVKDKSDVEVVVSLIDQIVSGYAAQNQGFREDQRRKYYKILDSFDEAEKNNSTIINLEDSWYDLLKECITKGKYMPSRLLQKIEDVILNPIEEK